MNFHAILAIYKFEMARAWRTLMQSVASPVISTALYFVVFGSAIGSHMVEIDGVSYGAFIVPGMIMLALLTQSIANASFGIYMPRFTGTIYEIHSAPISYVEIVAGYVGGRQQVHPAGPDHAGHGATVRVLRRGASVLDAGLPGADGGHVQPVRLHHRHLGRRLRKLQIIPLMIITPLTFLGGTFYSIKMLPPFWQSVTLLNPVVYLVSGFRWAFYGVADVSVGVSAGMTLAFLALCLVCVRWIFKTGYRLKT